MFFEARPQGLLEVTRGGLTPADAAAEMRAEEGAGANPVAAWLRVETDRAEARSRRRCLRFCVEAAERRRRGAGGGLKGGLKGALWFAGLDSGAQLFVCVLGEGGGILGKEVGELVLSFV